ncbi:MaoC/PaaZ C-terminal domain-containing protein [Sulfitobacter sp. D35]|uniref:MaoC family dehydratase n=1 Tax=Sulfitobacter sp. D35 TaxID=3083252 RepID=UPI00296F0D0C|nr:MaoC/PaaZ C-terminal domain-containing protein [Sulfitobacter sp. D35]MDW4499203.1 MaoC/PaaZ C-terminal domain-containing protein [Sulfitobacter sp. D35]
MTDLRQTWTPTQAEFDLFAKVSGDDNPIHVDPDFSARTGFGRTVSHGMLIYTKLWGMVRAARPESVALRQAMMFPNPTYAGEDVRLVVKGNLPGTVKMKAIRASDEAELFLGEAEVG